MVELPSWHSKGGGFSSAALGGSAALPWGTDPRTGQRAPTQEPALLKGEKCFCPGVLSLPVLARLCRGFPGSGSLVLWPCPFGFLVVFVPPIVSFYWPRASRSSSQREGRRVKLRGTDPRTGTGPDPRTGFFRYPSTCVVVVFLIALALLFSFLFATLFSEGVSITVFIDGCSFARVFFLFSVSFLVFFVVRLFLP